MQNDIANLEQRPDEYYAGNSESLEYKYNVTYFNGEVTEKHKEIDSSNLFTEQINSNTKSTKHIFTTQVIYEIEDKQNKENDITLYLLIPIILLLCIIIYKIIDIRGTNA